ncbi:MAG: TIR domain-containing protein [Verrucomicrobia bacterium]|nr:TIR domain-containing protein [Verrucomicrobiota bacterium]
MPAESSRAVFLSYASQDAEAARRICETLRAEGVEVWFDADGGLEHGDEWDAKIRRQIKECVLFLPIISANTQARLEGYFRIEWDLAAERARGIASGVPFILPVVIDDTREPDALVPDRFRMVQWTKLPGGVVTPEVKARYLKLWSHRIGATKHSDVARVSRPVGMADTGQETPATPAANRRVPAAAWIAAALLIGAAAGAVSWLRRPASGLRPALRRDASATTAPTTAPQTEARQLVAQARTLFLEGDDARRDNFFTAEELLKRALTLDPTDSEVWIAQALLSLRMTQYGYDRTPARMESLRTQAGRAVSLAPKSLEAALTQASSLGGWIPTDTIPAPLLADAIARLEAIVAREPANKLFRRELALVVYNDLKRREESHVEYDRAHALPGGDAVAMVNQAMNYFWQGRLAEAERSVAKSLTAGPLGRAHVLDTLLKLCWRADLDAAAASLERWPAWLFREDRGALVAGLVWLWRGDAEKARGYFRGITRDYVRDSLYTGPRAVLEAAALELGQRPDAARAEWSRVARAFDKTPDNANDALWHALALARVGEKDAAATAVRVAEQMFPAELFRNNDYWKPIICYDARDILAGPSSETFPAFARVAGGDNVQQAVFPAAALRLNPAFAAWRKDPRFADLLAKAPAPAADRAAAPAAPDPKSVAVLAFENKSEDKANEFFADEIAAELASLLQKIPGLRVTGRASAFSFKGKQATVPEIGRALGVAHVVEGSVQKSGNTVKITASLSRTDTGQAEWWDVYVKQLNDVFAVQTELAQTIVGKVRGQLGATAQAEIQAQVQAAQRGGTKNPAALELYLRGRAHYARGTSADVAQSITFYEQAIAADRGFAGAWAAVARARVWQGSFEPLVAERFRQARMAAEQALAMEPNLAEGHSVMSQVLQRHFFEWQKARVASARAVQLAPDDAEVLTDACTIGQSFGEWDRSIPAGQRAVSLDPLNPEPRLFLAISLFHAGRLAEAEASIRRAIELAPTAIFFRLIACQILLAAGKPQEALAEAKREPARMHLLEALALAELACGNRTEADAALKALESEFADSCPFQIAEVYAARNEPTPAFKWLEHAWAVKDPGLGWCRVAATLKNLHADPRWPAVLKKFGLADEQMK